MANSKKTCLVTGGAGFIGCSISKKLAENFSRVVVIDNLHPQIHLRQERPKALDACVELIVADVCDEATWSHFLTHCKPDVVIHLAAETGTGQSLTEGSRHALVNVVGTTRMLDAFANAKWVPERFVLSSSRAVYGEGTWVNDVGALVYPGQRSAKQLDNAEWDFAGLKPIPSAAMTTKPSPTSIYGATKLTQEDILRSWCLSFSAELAILRLQNVYGPGQSLSNPYTGIVSLFARLARDGLVIPIYEDGMIIRDFVLIDDVASAILCAVETAAPSQIAYDIGSGAHSSILQLAGLTAAHYGAPTPQINGKYRNGDVRFAACDISRAKSDLGWSPRFTLDNGIAQLCDWIETQLPARAAV